MAATLAMPATSADQLASQSACFTCLGMSVGNALAIKLWELISNNINNIMPCVQTGLIWGPNPETVDSIAGNLDDFTDNLTSRFPLSAYTELSFGYPVTVTNGISFNTSLNITSLEMRLLETVGAAFTLDGCTSLISLSVPSLISVGADMDVGGCPAITSLSFPLLATIGGVFQLNSSSALASLSVPVLATIGIDLDIRTTALISVSFPALTTVGVDVHADGIALVSFSAPVWIPTDGTLINFNGDALDIPSVELILRRCVLAGVIACTIDLSAGTNAGTASLGAQGQADVATLGAQVTMNP
jgi:hypothetical protein